jgi:hypothetical protein
MKNNTLAMIGLWALGVLLFYNLLTALFNLDLGFVQKKTTAFIEISDRDMGGIDWRNNRPFRVLFVSHTDRQEY